MKVTERKPKGPREITMFQLGDIQSGVFPSEKQVQNFEKALRDAVERGDDFIVGSWNFPIKIFSVTI